MRRGGGIDVQMDRLVIWGKSNTLSMVPIMQKSIFHYTLIPVEEE